MSPALRPPCRALYRLPIPCPCPNSSSKPLWSNSRLYFPLFYGTPIQNPTDKPRICDSTVLRPRSPLRVLPGVGMVPKRSPVPCRAAFTTRQFASIEWPCPLYGVLCTSSLHRKQSIFTARGRVVDVLALYGAGHVEKQPRTQHAPLVKAATGEEVDDLFIRLERTAGVAGLPAVPFVRADNTKQDFSFLNGPAPTQLDWSGKAELRKNSSRAVRVRGDVLERGRRYASSSAPRTSPYCPHETQRLSALGDGGKWVCGISRGEHSTSRTALSTLSITGARKGHTHFAAFGLAGADDEPKMYTLESLMTMNVKATVEAVEATVRKQSKQLLESS
ncbi:hypothetical protein B0H15DRAFT_803900 [Mycena belliarum]|uniref:Uncharacterized protein n=1 Tax=Mycena belliarum TaxID=1033014 RepID=A0AAD6TX95_9AGAR|nr:hypothetical protein B0H15DRAFT_803900 [Mycena belliae]